MGKTYKELKDLARSEAMEYQSMASTIDISYETLAWASEHFTSLGKRYGLLKEFKENGIL